MKNRTNLFLFKDIITRLIRFDTLDKIVFDSVLIKDAISKKNIYVEKVLDGKYQTISISDFLKLYSQSWIRYKKYIEEIWDCDDFSLALKNHFADNYGINSIGIIEGYNTKDLNQRNHNSHWCNIFVDSNLDVYIIEPQRLLIRKLEQERYADMSRYYFVPTSVICI